MILNVEVMKKNSEIFVLQENITAKQTEIDKLTNQVVRSLNMFTYIHFY